MLSIITKFGERVREAVLGRIEPSQLAWGVAFGVLVGLVPYTNLLALVLIAVVLCLRLNHGMAIGVGVVTATFSSRLDPLSHQVGRWVLTKDNWSNQLADFWQLPFIPWTDLNNTVVMGSLLLGTAALLPIFLLSYPLFHLFTTSVPPLPQHTDGAAEAIVQPKRRPTVPTQLATQGAVQGAAQSTVVQSVVFEPIADDTTPMLRALQPHAIDAALGDTGLSGLSQPTSQDAAAKASLGSTFAAEPSADSNPAQVIETRIDVIRLAKRNGQGKDQVEAADISKQDQPMSEALQYLLRQARDNQDRRAA